MPKFTRVVTVTIGASGAVSRSAQSEGDGPGFGFGPASVAIEEGRLRAVVPIHVTNASELEVERLAVQAGAYRQKTGGIEWVSLIDASAGWRAPPRRGQREGSWFFLVEAGMPPGAAGLWIGIAYAGAERLRALLPVPAPEPSGTRPG